MAENAPPPLPPSSSSVPPPPIAFPTHTSIHNLFPPAPTAFPAPMALLSSFFSENDPDNECDSFSQLLAGAMSSPGFGAPSNVRQNFFPQLESGDFRFQQNWLVASHTPGMFAIPPGLNPASLLQLPGIFSSSSQVSGQAQAQPQAQKQIQSEYTSLSTPSVPPSQLLASNSCLHQQMPPLLEDVKMDSTDMPLPDQKPQSLNVTVDKPANDGYNWRKYGQKQVKGSEFPRSYYKCTHLNCPVKKKVERSPEGQITEIIYKGQHNHPAPNKHAKDTRNSNGTINSHVHENSVFEGQLENLNNLNEGVPYLSSVKDQESSQVTPEHVSGSSDSEEVGNVETRVDERDEDEPEFKRRNVEVQSSEQHATNHRTVTEPRIIVQTTSEVDLLDDGYRWRKYGQKVVKGNPHPRSYYKCTNPGCNIRKHIERAASDPKAVITTYEGKHNHDVPAAKTNSRNIASSQPRPQVGRPIANVRTKFGEKGQQPVALLRFKEEQNIAFL